jgi:hypothetical protein
MTEKGVFIANFKENPPPIPSEYWIPLYGIIITTIVGWSIPSIIGWAKTKTDASKLYHYHRKITSLYEDGKLDGHDIQLLDKLKNDITDAYSKGKLNEKHYESLEKEISITYEEIFEKILSGINSTDQNIKERLKEIDIYVTDAYSKGKLNEKHYNLLKQRISEYKENNEG